MRSNMPVTNIEYVLQDTQTIVSKTDLQGNITYVNQDFIEISGFSEVELIGAPQNIVRHPDMPAEAFADFWQTVKAGRAWTGLVKNRCKNGDHYWVEANAAPYLEDGHVVGYTSIRVKPSRAQVAAAEQAYRAIKNGDRRLIIREGGAMARPGRLALTAWHTASLASKMNLALGLVAAVMLAMLWAALAGGAAAAYAVCGAGLCASTALLLGVRSAATAPFKTLRTGLEQMGSGDLSQHIVAGGGAEAAGCLQALRVLQINLKLLVGQIKEASGVVNEGAREIASGNADLSARTERQAGSLEETASSMEQMTSTVRQNAANARDADVLAMAAAKVAGEGGAAVDAVMATMSSIKHSSGRIADITAVIDSIAFQTNILALNAAVEAARAGEQGRGFAVVASEVRNLAHRSAAAAKEIKELIASSVHEVESGAQLAANAGQVMAGVVESVNKVEHYISDISLASKEQSSGIEQINEAIVQIDEITQQNAAVVEEAAAAAENMRRQADLLSVLIGHFQLVSASTPHSAGLRPVGRAASPASLALAPPAPRRHRVA
ncbi:methyl-accepting chemotaxis protein I [Janthinobacterium sp. HH01]|uniref:methyl-accepting chemotaxis protein n=1 Tax=Janthinobacterium sp. HH01 TaxID=1198452 RepID=UPI0002AEA936|nr:PAS domain-containing methyl-accepting chemotaxis protein [Janthinobacterium sp. HH01]ELX08814.1 methyl-accepting chemotaxis protein I [Janthinobacterium sp. HH01]